MESELLKELIITLNKYVVFDIEICDRYLEFYFNIPAQNVKELLTSFERDTLLDMNYNFEEGRLYNSIDFTEN